jgi:hypothetical protein
MMLAKQAVEQVLDYSECLVPNSVGVAESEWSLTEESLAGQLAGRVQEWPLEE